MNFRPFTLAQRWRVVFFLTGVLKPIMGLNAVFGLRSGFFVIAAAALYAGYFFRAKRDIAEATRHGLPAA